MPDISLDLETLGTRPGCGVLSIGAVAFDRHAGTLGPEFEIVINRASCKKHGLEEDASTLAWWGRQSEEARKVLTDAETAPNGLGGALIQFTAYLQQFGKRDLRIWALGASFDCPILAHCYAKVGQPLPWLYYRELCLRTLRELAGPDHVVEKKYGVAHSAIADARNQSLEAIQIFKKLRG